MIKLISKQIDYRILFESINYYLILYKKHKKKDSRVNYLFTLCETAMNLFFDNDFVYLVFNCLNEISFDKSYHRLILKNKKLIESIKKVKLN